MINGNAEMNCKRQMIQMDIYPVGLPFSGLRSSIYRAIFSHFILYSIWLLFLFFFFFFEELFTAYSVASLLLIEILKNCTYRPLNGLSTFVNAPSPDTTATRSLPLNHFNECKFPHD